MDRDELDKLSTDELHDRAVNRALKHVDVGFLWDLIKAIPVAEAVTGHVGAAENDIMSVSNLLNDLVNSDEHELGDALRPIYLDYLEKHP